MIDYARDGVRRVASINTTLNNQPQSIVSNITYRGDSQILSCTYGNGLQDTRAYDLQGRLLSQRLFEPTADDTIDQRAYSYDKNSNITSININGEETDYDRGYGYDRLDRLTSDGVGEDDPVTYGYDLNDNRQTRKQGTGINSIDELIDYMEGSNRIEEMDTLKRGTGQVLVIPDRTMTYSNTGRLYQLTENGTLKAEYIYNDLGQRTKKTLYQGDGITVGTTTIYHYDQWGMLITETDEQGNLINDYIWNGMNPAAQIDNNGGTETITYLYTDHLMTNRLATNQSKAIVWRWEGEAFGNTPAQELSGVSVNLRFPGQYYDSETNLHYNWNRYYDPSLGRYITSDPIGLDGGLNLYQYVSANPIRFIDPLGLLMCNCKAQKEGGRPRSLNKKGENVKWCAYKCFCYCEPDESGKRKLVDGIVVGPSNYMMCWGQWEIIGKHPKFEGLNPGGIGVLAWGLDPFYIDTNSPGDGKEEFAEKIDAALKEKCRDCDK